MSGQQVIVVGAGIAGLAAAFELQRAGFDVTVLERSDDVGGRMQTVQRDGFRIDTGATILLSSFTAVLGLAAEAGLASQVQPTSDHVGVIRDGTIHRMHSSSKWDGVRTPLLSLKGKAGLAKALYKTKRLGTALDDWADLTTAARYDGQNAGEYALRHLNEEILEYVIAPALGAGLLSPPEDVSSVDFLFILHHYLGKTYLNSPLGMGFLPQGLASQLSVELGAQVTNVEPYGQDVRVSWARNGASEQTDTVAACVVAVPAPHARAMCQYLAAPASTVLERMRYVPSVGVHLGLHTMPSDPAIWVAVPRHEDPSLVGVMFDHNKSPGRAPDGKGLVSSYWIDDWSRSNFDYDDDRVLQNALPGLDRIVPGVESLIETVHVQRWDLGLAVNTPGSHRTMATSANMVDSTSRIQFAGDYFGVTSTNASTTSGTAAARRVASALT
jgi:oxygen-dependent protoporphyrinogen oxidase